MSIASVEHFDRLRIGDTYLTRCVRLKESAQRYDASKPWWPIVGHLVSDEPVSWIAIGFDRYFEQRHFHVDARFSQKFGVVLTADQLVNEVPSMQPMKALRKTVPRRTNQHVHNAFQVIAIQNHLLDKSAACAKRNICPHKGARLDIAPHIMEDGRRVFVCPNHGLMFDQITGIMVQQFEEACNAS